ncbi:uncharacterized protein DS421_14g480060 [Arachis hypogaea]|nr:uncharacterized protein DS421_14g480060 [Arachis hypogaea]
MKREIQASNPYETALAQRFFSSSSHIRLRTERLLLHVPSPPHFPLSFSRSFFFTYFLFIVIFLLMLLLLYFLSFLPLW